MEKKPYDYIGLIEKFVQKTIGVSEFEETYIDRFSREDVLIGGEKFALLDWLFFRVDAYTDLPLEPEDNPDHYINEDQLRESAAKALREIRDLG